MGMDVYGKSPVSEKGSYFRNNVWWWRPLWDYCETFHGDLVGNVSGHYNDGDGLDEEGAKALAQRLFDDLEQGRIDTYAEGYRQALAALPMEHCGFCSGTGIRTDEVGVDMGMPDKALDEAIAIIVGRTHGWCNACYGRGEKESIAASYSFDKENVVEFATFLMDSGGFEIW